MVLVTSCSNTAPAVPQEFIAELKDFADYKSWLPVDTLHRTDNKEYRYTYINKTSELSRISTATGSGSYPVGTIIVKEIRNEDKISVKRFQIMVKRGNNFNPEGKQWEWFLVNNTMTSILSRGNDTVTVNGSTCKSCHILQNDLVFQHVKK